MFRPSTLVSQNARWVSPWLLCMMLGWSSSAALGQGVLISDSSAGCYRLPRPGTPIATPGAYRIKSLDVDVKLVDQIAQVQVAQTFENTGSQPLEVSFVFPLPYDGAIDRLTLMIDGKEVPAKLLPKDEARRRYQEVVRKNRDPALLEWLGAGMFQTSAFPVPAGAVRKVVLHYTQVCRNDHGLTDYLFPLGTAKYTAQPLETVNVRVALESANAIKNIYSPTHSVTIERSDDRHAVIHFEGKDVIPRDDFRMFFDVGSGPVGASIVSYRPEGQEDGYFLALASPEVKAADKLIQGKTVVLVLDRSGSMTGEKIEQAKGALRFVLNHLREGDLFNVVAYDTKIESFRPELQRYTPETRQAALGFAEGIFAGGSTNIDEALTTALAQLTDSSRPSYVLFLTDGLPTAGEKLEPKIIEHARTSNKVRARILCFGVGYDVNSRLLDGLARGNFGQSQYVRPTEDIEAHVSRLYSRIDSPVMNEVAVQFTREGATPDQGPAVTRVYPREVFDLFAGEQVVLVGRYKHAGDVKLQLSGSVSGDVRQLDFSGKFVEKSADDSFGFIEKLWAVRRVGEIIDELDLKGQSEELVKELVELSTRHGILTPYTSFLADENSSLDVADNLGRAATATQRLTEAAGEAAFSQRCAKSVYQNQSIAPSSGFGNYWGFRDANVQSMSVCNIGQKSFYRRNDQWVDSTVTQEQIDKAKPIESFSDEYFRLADQHGRQLSQYLAFDEPTLVKVDGTCYLIQPAK